MMRTAKFIRFLPTHLRGSLYEVSHKVKFGSERTNFVNIISIEDNKVFKELVTLAYPADAKMHFLARTPLPLSQVKGQDPEACLKKIGFQLVVDTKNNKENDYEYDTKRTLPRGRKANWN